MRCRFRDTNSLGLTKRVIWLGALTTLAAVGCSGSSVPTKISAAATVPSATDSLSGEFERAVDALPAGVLIYNAPSVMRVGSSQTVGVVISRTFKNSVERSLSANGPTAVTSVRVGSGMKAFLVATPPAAFSINPLQDNSEEQVFDSAGQMQWSWAVTPSQAGNFELDIVIEAAVDVPNRPERHFRTVKRVQLPVKAKPILEQVGDFVSGDWHWLLSTLLIPLGIWGFRRFTERSKANPSSA